MANARKPGRWKALDKDLSRIGQLELATQTAARPGIRLVVALVFIALVALLPAFLLPGPAPSFAILAAAAFGAYMALNVGANDVANNMGPAVGARALTMGGALLIAALFESLGALVGGRDVVATISRAIVEPAAFAAPQAFVWAMMAALIAAALWVNFATLIGAPVSTTHAIVGGVIGAGIAAAGFAAVNWQVIGVIAASWVISPAIGGLLAALFLAFIKRHIIYTDDKIAAARRWVPVLIGLMVGAFAAYLALKGLRRIVPVGLPAALVIGAALGAGALALSRPLLRRQSAGLEDRRTSLKALFATPLVISAALLSFAHGANDVAAAVGPVAGILQVAGSGAIVDNVAALFWTLLIGAVGVSLGLLLFGPRLVRMAGSQITKLNPIRAFCVALSAAVTVIAASGFGLPVSATHVAVGGVFGVGFYREWHNARRRRARKLRSAEGLRLPAEELRRRKLVRRSHFMTILAAWLITLPAAGALSALVFLALSAATR